MTTTLCNFIPRILILKNFLTSYHIWQQFFYYNLRRLTTNNVLTLQRSFETNL